jgi:hypothetical protein
MGGCLSLCGRMSDYRFADAHKTAYEKEKTKHLGNTVSGFLIWRRTLLLPMTVLMCLTLIMRAVSLFVTYFSENQVQFMRNFFGEVIWSQVYCTNTPGPCDPNVMRSLRSIFYVLMATDTLLWVSSLVACVLLVLSSRRWAKYSSSSKYMRRAYGFLFLAPFALVLLLPPAQFLEVDLIQTALCQERVQQLTGFAASNTDAAAVSGAASSALREVCEQPIEEWRSTVNETIVNEGRLTDRRTGSCAFADDQIETLREEFEGACVDLDNEIRSATGNTVGSCRHAARLGACVHPEADIKAGVQAACPMACGLCESSVGSNGCFDNNGIFATWEAAGLPNPWNITDCPGARVEGLCTHLNQEIRQAIRKECPLSCDVCEAAAPPCEDNNVAFALSEHPDFPENCEQWNGLTPPWAPDGLCTRDCDALAIEARRQLCTFGQNNCKETCGTCPGRRARALQSFSMDPNEMMAQISGEDLFRLDGCVDPMVVQAVGVLEVSLSDSVLVGSVALRRSSTVLATLLPAALGVALGAGQGSTLAKAVMPGSRLPTRLAGFSVMIALPVLAALLGVINQMLASIWGTLACLSVLCMVTVWLPSGTLGTLCNKHVRKAVGATKGGDIKTDSDVLLEPADAPAVVKAIARRKYMLSGFMLLCLLFAACFTGLSTATSMVTEQFEELKRSWDQVIEHGAWSKIALLVITILQTAFELVAKTYLAQVFYTDSACVAITLIWHSDRADGEAMAKLRSDEMAQVAEALERSRDQRRQSTRYRTRTGETTSSEVGTASAISSSERDDVKV